MAAKKKTTKRNSATALHETLDRLEKDLPPNLGKLVKQVRRGLTDLEKQVERTRKDSEARWERQQNQVRRDIAGVLRKLEKAVEPSRKSARKSPRRKAAAGASTAS
jgi:hypothetical protein